MIAAKVAMVDLVVELNLPLSTLDRNNKVFKKVFKDSDIAKAKGQLKMFLFLVQCMKFLFFMSAVLLFCH